MCFVADNVADLNLTKPAPIAECSGVADNYGKYIRGGGRVWWKRRYFENFAAEIFRGKFFAPFWYLHHCDEENENWFCRNPEIVD